MVRLVLEAQSLFLGVSQAVGFDRALWIAGGIIAVARSAEAQGVSRKKTGQDTSNALRF